MPSPPKARLLLLLPPALGAAARLRCRGCLMLWAAASWLGDPAGTHRAIGLRTLTRLVLSVLYNEEVLSCTQLGAQRVEQASPHYHN